MWYLVTAAISPVSDEDAKRLRDSTGLECVGRLDNLGSIYRNPNNDKYDLYFSEYLASINYPDRFLDYGVCRPTVNRELKAVSRYSLPTVDQPPSPAIQEKLLSWLEYEFGPYVEGYRVIDFDEVDVQGSTTPGIPYKWYYRKKRDAIKHCKSDIQSFWDYAHKIECPVIWHNFVKEELLPTRKLEDDNVRSITGPDVAFFMCQSRMVQDFNKKLYTACLKTSSALGLNKFEGGLTSVARKVNKHPHKEEADMSKYDARLVAWIRKLCMVFRWRMMNASDRTPENWVRLNYYYQQEIYSYLATGLGYVLYVNHGIKSGSPNTSSDGTLIHFLVIAYSYITNVSDDYSHFRRNVEVLIYGDDELISMSDEVVGSFCAEARAPCYEACGVHFKLDETRSSVFLEGLTFLGNRFKMEPSGYWIGEPTDPRKMVASALKPLRKQTPGESLLRAYALLIESFWCPWARDLLYGYIKYMQNMGIQPDTNVHCDEVEPFIVEFAVTMPTLRRIRALWLGLQ